MSGQMIAVTGKGGVGKSTVAGLIVRYLKRNTPGPILALDADPDANLATVLGIEVEQTIGDLREDVQKAIKDFPPGMSKENYVEAGLHQIIVETPKVDMITMGRSEGPGCYCFLNNMLRKFADELLPEYRWVVMDNEAGLEHLSRRTASRIDHLIVVVNENPLAVDCARRIDELLIEMDRDVRKKYFILNAVRDDRIQTVLDKMAGLNLEFLGTVPRDDAVEEAMFRGEPIFALETGPAVESIDEVMKKIGAG
jgi:CO dehydrogenase maturation factor